MKLALCLMVLVCSLLVNVSFTIDELVAPVADLSSIESLPQIDASIRAIFGDGNLVNIVTNLIDRLVKAVRFIKPIISGKNSNYCKQQTCKKPNFLIPATEYLLAPFTPVYLSCLPRTNYTEKMDNICYTIFQVDNSTGVMFCYSIVFSNGTNKRSCYLNDDGPGNGVLTGANPTCTFEEYLIGIECADCLILYRCYLTGACQDLDLVLDPGYDQVFAACLSPNQSESCKDGTIKTIKSFPEYNLRPDFHKLPQKLPNQCVTCLPTNGTAVNTGKRRENDKSCGSKSAATNDTQIDVLQLLAVIKKSIPSINPE